MSAAMLLLRQPVRLSPIDEDSWTEVVTTVFVGDWPFAWRQLSAVDTICTSGAVTLMGFTTAALCPTCCWPCKPFVSHIISAACLVKSYECCHFTHVSFFVQTIMGKLDFLPHRVRHQVKHEVSTKSCYLLVMHGVYLALLYHLAWWPKAECPCHALLNYHCCSMLTCMACCCA